MSEKQSIPESSTSMQPKEGRPRGKFLIAAQAAALAMMVLGGCMPNHGARINSQLTRDIDQAEALNARVDEQIREVRRLSREAKNSIVSAICDMELIISRLDPNHPGDLKIREKLEKQLAKMKAMHGECR
jgi:type II secretory pathway component PulM